MLACTWCTGALSRQLCSRRTVVALAREAGRGDAAAQQLERRKCELVRVRLRVTCWVEVRVEMQLGVTKEDEST